MSIVRRSRQPAPRNGHRRNGFHLDERSVAPSTPGGPSWNSIASAHRHDLDGTTLRPTGHTSPDQRLGTDIYRPAGPPPSPTPAPAPPPNPHPQATPYSPPTPAAPAAPDTDAWPAVSASHPHPSPSADFVHYESDLATAPMSALSSPAAARPVEEWEARSLAGAFAADLLSWDEDQPQLWHEVIHRYLPGADVASLGVWSGAGRQRVEVVLPGLVRRDDPTHVQVEVRVRITVYVSNPRAPHGSTTDERPDLPAHMVASTAPPPAAAGWRGCSAQWARLMVPITRNLAGELAINPALTRGKESPA